MRPANHIHGVDQHVDHRGDLVRAFQDLEGLRARVVHPGRSAEDPPQPALYDLLLAEEVVPRVTLAVVHVQFDAAARGGLYERVRITQAQGQGRLDHDAFSARDGLQDRLDVPGFGCGHDDGGDVGVGYRLLVVARGEMRSHLLAQRLRPGGVDI